MRIAARMYAAGLAAPASAATVAGRTKIPDPMTPFTAIAVRPARPTARTRRGVSTTPGSRFSFNLESSRRRAASLVGKRLPGRPSPNRAVPGTLVAALLKRQARSSLLLAHRRQREADPPPGLEA